MIVAIDLTALSRPTTGTERYSLELAKALLDSDPSTEFFLLFRDSVHPAFIGRKGRWTPLLSPFRSQVLTEQLWIPYVARNMKADVFHFTFFPPGLLFFRPFVITVYDANLWMHPDTLSMKTRLYTRPLTRRAVKRASRVLAISTDTAGDLNRHAGVPAERIACVGIGIPELFITVGPNTKSKPFENVNIREPFILMVGTLDPRKNVPLAVDAFATYLRRHPSSELQLVLAGRPGWGATPVHRAISRHHLEDRVRILGHVPDDQLKQLYSRAECLAYPSRYEGFGLPVFEAIACGTPVICSDIPPFNSLVRGVATFVDPAEPDSLVSAMENVLGKSSSRELTREYSERLCESLTWDKVALRTLTEYRKLCS
jgi:glycosyltransferase involved in cell wall biosynthesis